MHLDEDSEDDAKDAIIQEELEQVVLANCMTAVEGILEVERKKNTLRLEEIDEYVKGRFNS
jgi:hypothetical protein